MLNNRMLSLTVFLLVLMPLCSPASICETLLPFNGSIRPIKSVPPFNIVTSVSTVERNQILTIQIKSVSPELRATEFMIQARSTSPPFKVHGRFTSSIDGLTLINCNGVDNTAIYHMRTGTEEEILQWQAPNDFSGEVLFKATISEQHDKFWFEVESAPLEIGRKITLLPHTVNSTVTQHTADIVEENIPIPVVRVEQRNNELIYDECGRSKTCFGFPNNCVEQRSCEAIVTATVLGNRYQFELQSGVANVAYVALGLSRDAQMGDDSVVECIPEGGIIRAYTSWNNRRDNVRQDVPQGIISLLDSSYVDGTIYCKVEREVITTILGNQFNLASENFHFLVAIGTTISASLVTRHDLGRIASSEPVDIIKQNIYDPIYDGCGTTKTCYGLPIDCVEQESCQAIATAVAVGNRYQFELKSGVDNIAYVAFGLSRTAQMGDDSVMECIQEGGIIRAYTSWNNRRDNTRDGVPQNVISLLNSSFVDGTIYCKLERDSFTTIQGHEYDLARENFHFLIAIGSTVSASAITRHDLGRIVSSEPLEIVESRIDNSIYEGCGTIKTCFGLPDDCVEQQACQAVVTAIVLDNRYQFELKSVANNVAYVALGLSRDDQMGDDSVLECIPEGGSIQAYSSWNYRRDNIRQGVPQDMITLINSSYIDGSIYCKVERERFTTIFGNQFDLVNEDFHFLVAIGSTVSGSNVTRHDLGRIASRDPIPLAGSGHSATEISIISIVIWFLATSFSNHSLGL